MSARVLCLVGGLLLAVQDAGAQFVTPVPEPVPDDTVRVQLLVERFRFQRDSLGVRAVDFCTTFQPGRDAGECRRALLVADSSRPDRLVTWYRPPFQLRRSRSRAYYATEDDGRMGIFRRLNANLDDEQIVVVTDVVSGTIGVFDFALSTAASASDPDSVAGASEDQVEEATNAVARLIQNGGSVTGRLLYPLYAVGGINTAAAASVYTQLGAVGPVTRSDELGFSGAVVGEQVLAFDIRDHGPDAGFVGRLSIGVRGGWAFTGDSVSPELVPDKSFAFGQLAVGLATESSVGLSVLLTWASGEAGDFKPRATFNLAATR